MVIENGRLEKMENQTILCKSDFSLKGFQSYVKTYCEKYLESKVPNHICSSSTSYLLIGRQRYVPAEIKTKKKSCTFIPGMLDQPHVTSANPEKRLALEDVAMVLHEDDEAVEVMLVLRAVCKLQESNATNPFNTKISLITHHYFQKIGSSCCSNAMFVKNDNSICLMPIFGLKEWPIWTKTC